MSVYKYNPNAIQTAAEVDLVTSNNVTWNDSFQFDPPGMTGFPPPPYWPAGASGPTWTFQNQNFVMNVKTNINASGPIASWTSSNNQIVVDDVANRVLHMNIDDSQFSALGMVPGTFIYEFIMFDGSIPPIRVMLMKGKFALQPGYAR